MKKILVLHTGGTISMHEDQFGKVTTDNVNPLMHATIELPPDVELVVENIFNLPSPHITVQHMLLLKKRIVKAMQEENVTGVVITHGTDTLEETAFFLDATILQMLPIVLTGAMRSSNELGSDGLYNFLSAIRVATCEQAVGKGVLVVMNDEIHTARYVTKTHTTNVATFRTPTHGPIGIVNKKQIVFFHQLNHHQKFDVQEMSGKVPIVKAFAGMSDAIFSAFHKQNIDGLVIEALGAGNLPPTTVDSLKTLLKEEIPVVLVSRCFNGVAEAVYDYPGGGVQLEKLGVLFCNGINSQKARLKLLIGIHAKLDKNSLCEYIRKP